MTTAEGQSVRTDGTQNTTNRQEDNGPQATDSGRPDGQRSEGTPNSEGQDAEPTQRFLSTLRFDHVVTLLVIGATILVMRMSPLSIGPFVKVVTASLFVVTLLVAYSRQADVTGGTNSSLTSLIDELTDVVAVLAVVGLAIGLDSVPEVAVGAIVTIALGKRALSKS